MSNDGGPRARQGPDEAPPALRRVLHAGMVPVTESARRTTT